MTDSVSPLVGVDELAAMLAGDVPPALLDVRWSLAGPPGREQYDDGHIEGACFVDLDRDLADPPGERGRHPLPGTARFQDAMRSAGVRADAPVVVYDAADGTSAARAWWLLGYHGHRDVRLLDGGIRAWRAAGRAVCTEPCARAAGDFTARPGARPLLDAHSAGTLASDGVLLDARAGERYRGEVEPIDPVAGHIPGALSAPTTDNVDATGRFRSAEQLRARFAALGARSGAAVGVYCGSGVTAAHEVLALELAGVRAALYVGSWSEWIADGSRAIVTGDRPC